ncbi:PAS domain-containing protein [Calothrix sp. PCC 6303]|uniref:PAS domain-containing sensor histidine kinase n=1 Tax=Calothrix sp. PCC 6303 TaxID=1170562 RepID=UPI0002A03F99|nr:PAS domain-containing protein [Calothrix sp. PCC 6303]AFZ03023.1 PAS/PAC sensor signal transduction histidine kinase [Calothrix sp. PCC 6303]
MSKSGHLTTDQNNLDNSQLALFAQVWNAVECGMYVLEVLNQGEEFRCVALNPAMERIVAIPAEEILGKTITQMMDTLDTKNCHEHYLKCLDTGKVVSYEQKFRINGKFSYWLLTAAPIYGLEGTIDKLIVTVHDISGRKNAEAQVKEKEDFLLSIYDGCSTPIFVIDVLENNHFIVAGYNTACEKITKLSSSEIAGKTMIEVFGEDIGSQMQRLYIECVAFGLPITYEEYILVNGQKVWGLTTINPVKDSSGNIYRLIGTTTEITEIKNIQVKLEIKAQELEDTIKKLASTQSQLIQTEKMSSLGHLVAGIAHEINNPSNFIYGNITFAQEYIQRLLDLLELYQQCYPNPIKVIKLQIKAIELDFIREDLPLLLASIEDGAERIAEIVTSLRNFSRLDEAEYKSVDIHQGIDNTLKLLEYRLKSQSRRAEIKVIKEYANIPLIYCYVGQLNQVVMNILMNAIDALEESDTVQPKIDISTEIDQNKFFVMTISNNGSIIPHNIQQKIFDPFFTTKSVGKGTGMGLSISYQIITEKHGGTLECISEPDVGTKFIIKIPQ